MKNYCYKTTQKHKFLKFIFGIKLYKFRTVPLSIIRSFYCTHSSGIRHTACAQDQDGAAGPSWSRSQLIFHKTLWKERLLKNFVGYTKYVFFISSIALSGIFLIVQIFEWFMIINVDRSFVQYALLFTDFKHTWILSTEFQRPSWNKFHVIISIRNRSFPRASLEEQADRFYWVSLYFSKYFDFALGLSDSSVTLTVNARKHTVLCCVKRSAAMQTEEYPIQRLS